MDERQRAELCARIEQVKARIARAARAAGRAPENITLVAATKMNDAQTVRAAIAGGVSVCGENRVQELLQKDEQGAYQGADLHFIGRLQRNKAKYLVGRVSLIHSVSSLALAQTIDALAAQKEIVQDILIQINIANEASKDGITIEKLSDLLNEIVHLRHIFVRGLMCIPPIEQVGRTNDEYFAKMQQVLVDNLVKKYDNVSMDFLSMGMTGDFERAIQYGATHVRIGTAIFGARNYS